MIQPKLELSRPGDALEREADQVAMSLQYTRVGDRPPMLESPGGEGPRLSRLAKDETTEGGLDVPPIVHEALRTSGRPLDYEIRASMEAHLDHDFSSVYVHTDHLAEQSAHAIRARAYTAGNDIVFGAGQYAPGSDAGQRLLAHELTHVVQQGGSANAVQRDGEPGTSVYSEHTESMLTSTAEPGVWSGTVRREERTQSGRLFQTGRAPVHYDENSCRVTIPMTVRFRHATLSDVRNCPPRLNQPAPTSLPAAVSETTLRSIAARYIETLNTDLNGWYSVRFDGCESNHCHGRDMPINVEVSEATGGATPNYEVAVANMRGRSCVDDSGYRSGRSGTVLLYALGLSSGTMAHEGVHMVLGHGDEYREEERPSSGRPEDRVREGDWSLAGSHSRFGRFSLLHERHFAFVPEFLNHARQGCNARLVELQRPPQVDVTITFSAGYTGFQSSTGDVSSGEYISLGASLGIPLSRQREWEFLIGLNSTFLAELEQRYRMAFLTGLRVGLDYTTTPSAGGFTAGAFGEMGVSVVGSGGRSSDWTTGSYVEGGAYLGYTTSALGGGLRMPIRLEAAYGAAFRSGGTIGTPGVAVPTDPTELRYFRIGLSAAWRF